jgi:hypothetical protein
MPPPGCHLIGRHALPFAPASTPIAEKHCGLSVVIVAVIQDAPDDPNSSRYEAFPTMWFNSKPCPIFLQPYEKP